MNNGDDVFISNQLQTYHLPSTGGVGAEVIYAAGIALLLAAAICWLTLRKKQLL